MPFLQALRRPVPCHTALVLLTLLCALRVDPVPAGRLGMTADQVGNQVQAALLGDVVTQ